MKLLNRALYGLLLGALSMPVLAQTEGTVKWTYSAGGLVGTSPAIGVDGTVYVVSGDAKLHAVNLDGTVRWTYSTSGSAFSSPAIGADGTVYVGSGDAKLHAVNPDGTVRWTYSTSGSASSSPAIGGDGTVYVGSFDLKLHAVNPDGTVKWIYSADGPIYSSPAIGADGTVYVGSEDDRLHAVNPDGTVRWTYSTSGSAFSSPAIGADGTVYVGSGDAKLHAVNPDGTQKWTYSTDGVVRSSPAIGTDGTVYVGSFDLKLHAVNPDGTQKWTYTTSERIYSSPAIGADGTVYVGSNDDRLHAVNPDGTQKWTYRTYGDVSSSPTIGADGTVYVGSHDHKLYAVRSRSLGLGPTPWPKFRQNHSNTGSLLSALAVIPLVPLQFEFFKTGETIDMALDAKAVIERTITLNSFTLSHPAFSLITPLPLVVPGGGSTPLTIRILPDTTDLYESTFQYSYDVGGTSRTSSGRLASGLFLDDDSELSYAAHLALDAYRRCETDDPLSVATENNRGVILRLLGAHDLAASSFQSAMSASLNANYGYSGIKMNLGVVKSDLKETIEATELYDSAVDDVSDEEASSVLAPRLYYNKAWEAYRDGDMAEAVNQINQTIAHIQANAYLQAKAYVLRGAIRANEGENGLALTDFGIAASLDPNGPIGRMAKDNVITIETDVEEGLGDNLPEHFVLLPTYPNPFTSETIIRFGLPQSRKVDLVVHTVLGQRLQILYTGRLPSGWHSFSWNGTDGTGNPVASGVYIVHMKAGEFKTSQQTILVR